MKRDFDYIGSDEQLSAFSTQIANEPWLGVDTEFMRERTYYAQLALIQVATDSTITLIDVPALSDLSPLRDAFEHSECLKIIHSASQDIEVLDQALGVIPGPLFDTQIAASFLGEADQIAYGAIVKQRLGITLDKDQTRTNWLQRPLSEAQLGYAQADVLYLYDLYQQLVGELETRGRLNWVYEESKAMAERTRRAVEPALAWQRIKALSRMSPQQQHIVAALANWREQRAQQRNLPREWVLKKQALVDIARIQPESYNKLAQIESVGEKAAQRIAKPLLKLVQEARQHSAVPLVAEELTGAQRNQAKNVMGRLRDIAEAEHIAPALIANRNTIESLVGGERNLPLLQGWRAEIAGKELLVMLEAS